ncbi:MAG TPA: 3-hydroxyacyl-CoA dehydrogenase family protein [Rectinemataceae bacterium]|nr:3-hydroxyacyl-CoA dehydrogenase family protein [Rectinemataceae bacterium]
MRNSVMVIGGGMMGSGIAAISAIAGNPTIIIESSEQARGKCPERVRGLLNELAENSLISEKTRTTAIENISYGKNPEEEIDKAFFVIEAIVEDLAAKQEIFRRLDELLPEEVPIVSNTSGLRITDIARFTKHPERTATAHFWFPAHLVPLVEVVMSDSTSMETAEWVMKTLKAWGKAPVLVKRDLPGQLANRILQAVIREASHIVEIGLASAEDVDTAVKMGMGIRFPVWGPLEHVDAVGVDLCNSVQNTVLPGISDSHEANSCFAEMVESGNLGYKTGKGFYDWSKKDMEALAKLRNEFIIHALKKIKSQP